MSCDFTHQPTTPHNTHTRTTHQSHWFRVWLKANTQTSPPAAALGETVNYWMYVQTMSHQIHVHQTDSPTGCAFSCDVFKNSRARARRLAARLLLHIVRRWVFNVGGCDFKCSSQDPPLHQPFLPSLLKFPVEHLSSTDCLTFNCSSFVATSSSCKPGEE